MAREFWYVTFRSPDGKALQLYGPFATERDAQRAAYTARPVEERDAAGRQARIDVYVNSGYSRYDDNEVRALAAHPTEFGYRHVTVRAAKATPVHPTWRTFDPAFVEQLFASDSGEAR